MTRDILTDKVQKDLVSRLVPSFGMEDKILYYKDRIFVPRFCVRKLIHLSHDCRVGGHFYFAKTLGRVEKYHWKTKHKT